MQVTPGANVAVPTAAVRTVLSWQAGPGTPEIDALAVLLGPSGRVRDDADLVFYNQPRHVSGAVRYAGGDRLEIDLPDVEPDVDRIVLAASADGGTFGQVGGLDFRLVDGGGGAIAEFPMSAATESALVAGELYRRGDGWKFRALGQGYADGLAELAVDYGIAVDEDEPVTSEPAAPEPEPATVVLPAPPAPQPSFEWPENLAPLPFTQQAAAPVDQQWEARKARVEATLAKQGTAGLRARVVLVLDASGSMSTAYLDGIVARIVERVAAIAAVLDIGVLPVWKFADTALRLPDLHVEALRNWLGSLDYHGVGLQNNEPAAIREVLQFAGAGPDPTLVLFFADSDVRKNLETSTLLRMASGKPVFWQFVGLGRIDFTRYQKLDTMGLRKVDNCGFATVRRPDRIDDRQFYEVLLAEFPRWLAAARAKGIV